MVKAIVCLMVLLSFLVPLDKNTVQAAYTYQGKVNADLLNVRSKPGTGYSKVGKLKRNDIITVVGKSKSWSKVSYGKKTGWVFSKYLVPVRSTGYVTASSLNLRKSYTTKSASIESLPKGTAITIKGTNKKWLKVYVPSKKKTGWVAAKYISAKKPVIVSKSLGTYYVTATTLNIRQKPYSTANIVSNTKYGEAVKVYNKKGLWYEVQLSSGLKGWAAAKFLSLKKPVSKAAIDTPASPTDESPISDNTNLVLKVNSNVRTGPGTSFPILSVERAGTLVKQVEESGDWIKVRKDNGEVGWVAGWLLRTPESVLKGRVIVLDPGHGGRDNGTSGKIYPEKQLVLRTAQELAPLLQKAGAQVVFTRDEDFYLTLDQRVDISHLNKADAFISIHYNAFSSTSSGLLTFYYSSAQEGSLAKMIQAEMVNHTGLKDRGSKFGNYHVLRENKRPAVLLELGFLSNPTEEKLVATSSYQKNVSKGIYEGIFKYFLNK
jgi:N-acetylmuramoyl-L-alanine amidase